MKLPQSLQQEWAQKLKDSGFNDIENKKGQIKTPDLRTQNFQDREILLEFFLSLDNYLTNTTDSIHPAKRRILELYSAGTYIKVIAKTMSLSTATVKNVIKHYKDQVLRFQHEQDRT